MEPAIFLDRDGVIIENRANYVRSWDDVEIYPQALTVLRLVAKLPYKLVIVTNQSAVGRGIVSLPTAQAINLQLVEIIQQAGGRVDAVQMCPHAPDEDCLCRKPRPGLLYQAAAALNVELRQSIMIGDALTDVMAGQAAGVKQSVLLRTGRGAQQENLAQAKELPPFVVYDTLKDALGDCFDLFD